MGEESVTPRRGDATLDGSSASPGAVPVPAVRPLGGERFELSGRATIKGVTRDVAGSPR